MRNPIKGLKAMLITGPIDSIYNQIHIKCYMKQNIQFFLRYSCFPLDDGYPFDEASEGIQ